MMTANVIFPSTPGSDDSPVSETKKKRTSKKKTSSSKTAKPSSRSISSSSESNSTCDFTYAEGDTSSPLTKKRKKQVKQACAGCKKAHTRCEDVRPCPRCKSMKVECVDAPRKKRKQRDAASVAEIPQPSSPNHQQTTTNDDTIPVFSSTYQNELEVNERSPTKRRKRVKVETRGRKKKTKTTQRHHHDDAEEEREEEDENTNTTEATKSMHSSIDSSDHTGQAMMDDQFDSEDQEAEVCSSSSQHSSSEDCGVDSDDLNGVYIYHQHHHLLYQDHNNLQNTPSWANQLNWDYYYGTEREVHHIGSLRNTTLSALYYGVNNPSNSNNSYSMDTYGSSGSSGSIGNMEMGYNNNNNNNQRVVYGNSGNVYYQQEDLQRVRENYLTDWLY